MNLKEQMSREATEVDRVMQQEIRGFSTSLDPLLADSLEYALFSGGKRVRPLLAILSARLCGCRDAGIYRLASAFEYLHVATLMHDDVIDRANTRRGQLTVNRQFGKVEAILAGDFLHAHAMAVIGECGGREALDVFTAATRGMVDGEFVQLRNARNYNQSESDYFSVVMGKTALLIGAACEIGGIYGGGNEVCRQALRTYGLNLGTTFQIVDDLLDYLGSGAKTGKAIGNDLAEGKMTLPLILAMQRADDQDRHKLVAILQDSSGRRSRFPDVCTLIERYQGFSEARRQAVELADLAIEALAPFAGQNDSDIYAILRELTLYVLERQR